MNDASIDPSTALATSSASVRCFAGLTLEPAARVQLGRWGEQLADVHPEAIVALHPSNLHVTFVFLGDVPESTLPEVALALGAAAAGVPGPISCDVAGATLLGTRSTVVAAVVDIDMLAPLAAARDSFVEVAGACGARGVDRRPWRPHVSVAEAIGGRSLENVLEPSRLEAPATSWIAHGISLVASITGPGGSRHYRALRLMPFAGSVAAVEHS